MTNQDRSVIDQRMIADGYQRIEAAAVNVGDVVHCHYSNNGQHASGIVAEKDVTINDGVSRRLGMRLAVNEPRQPVAHIVYADTLGIYRLAKG